MCLLSQKQTKVILHVLGGGVLIRERLRVLSLGLHFLEAGHLLLEVHTMQEEKQGRREVLLAGGFL